MEPSPNASFPDWPRWLQANGRRYLLFARSQARCEADAHDLLQEALVEVWRRAGGDRPPDDALVFRTIRRRAIDLGRRNDRRARRELAAPPWWTHPASVEAELDAELARAVQELPAHLREVVLLKVWGDLTFRQIAGALEVPTATAASRYRYALGHLRTLFKEARS